MYFKAGILCSLDMCYYFRIRYTSTTRARDIIIVAISSLKVFCILLLCVAIYPASIKQNLSCGEMKGKGRVGFCGRQDERELTKSPSMVWETLVTSTLSFELLEITLSQVLKITPVCTVFALLGRVFARILRTSTFWKH